MSAIGPGSLLVCMKEAQHVPGGAELTVGAIYRCEGIVPSLRPCPSDRCGRHGVTLMERPRGVYRSHFTIGFFEFESEETLQPIYCPNVFRPLDDGDTSLVEDEEVQPEGLLGATVPKEFVRRKEPA